MVTTDTVAERGAIFGGCWLGSSFACQSSRPLLVAVQILRMYVCVRVRGVRV